MKTHCPKCKKQLRLSRSHIGRRIQCPKCQSAFVIPFRNKKTQKVECAIEKTRHGKYQSRYSCPACAERLRSDEKEVGKVIPCPACSIFFEVPGSRQIREIHEDMARRERAAKEKARLERKAVQARLDEQRRQEEVRRAEES